jgi:hypothetical protein
MLNLPCHLDKPRQISRSKELLDILTKDQIDRDNFDKKKTAGLNELRARDTARRMRVGEIFSEGCFQTSADFAAGAILFQHGEVSEHYYQAFIWANRAVELGDHTQRKLMALAIDRFLVSIGKKQLFGTQAYKGDLDQGSCWCLEKTEITFPDYKRETFTGRILQESIDWIKSMNKGKGCHRLTCEKSLDDTPQGSIPGFW